MRMIMSVGPPESVSFLGKRNTHPKNELFPSMAKRIRKDVV